MRRSKLLFLASWVILLILAVAVTVSSLGSLFTAYTAPQDNLIPTFTLDQLRSAGGEEAVKAFKGRRATAATWALAAALLTGWVVLFPYRKGERWAWWALLVSLGLAQILSLARAIALGTTFGTTAPAVLLAFLLLGLLAGAPRIFSARDEIVEL